MLVPCLTALLCSSSLLESIISNWVPLRLTTLFFLKGIFFPLLPLSSKCKFLPKQVFPSVSQKLKAPTVPSSRSGRFGFLSCPPEGLHPYFHFQIICWLMSSTSGCQSLKRHSVTGVEYLPLYI